MPEQREHRRRGAQAADAGQQQGRQAQANVGDL